MKRIKHIITFVVMAAALLTLSSFSLSAADNADGSARWIDKVSVSTVGAVKTEHLDGPSQWGAGLDIGANLNPFVGIHIVNLSFEGADHQWGGLAVDETELLVDAKLSRFSNENFSLHLVSGGQWDWNDHDYGINAGLKVELALNKTLAVSAGYSIRTWFKGQTRVDSLATAAITASF
jgi:hypothetical protein